MGQSQQKGQLLLSDGPPHLLMEIRVIRILFYFFKKISHVMPCYATVHNAVLS